MIGDRGAPYLKFALKKHVYSQSTQPKFLMRGFSELSAKARRCLRIEQSKLWIRRRAKPCRLRPRVLVLSRRRPSGSHSKMKSQVRLPTLQKLLSQLDHGKGSTCQSATKAEFGPCASVVYPRRENMARQVSLATLYIVNCKTRAYLVEAVRLFTSSDEHGGQCCYQ